MAQIHSVDISRIILVLEAFLLDGVIQSELSVIETIDQIVQQNRFFACLQNRMLPAL